MVLALVDRRCAALAYTHEQRRLCYPHLLQVGSLQVSVAAGQIARELAIDTIHARTSTERRAPGLTRHVSCADAGPVLHQYSDEHMLAFSVCDWAAETLTHRHRVMAFQVVHFLGVRRPELAYAIFTSSLSHLQTIIFDLDLADDVVTALLEDGLNAQSRQTCALTETVLKMVPSRLLSRVATHVRTVRIAYNTQNESPDYALLGHSGMAVFQEHMHNMKVGGVDLELICPKSAGPFDLPIDLFAYSPQVRRLTIGPGYSIDVSRPVAGQASWARMYPHMQKLRMPNLESVVVEGREVSVEKMLAKTSRWAVGEVLVDTPLSPTSPAYAPFVDEYVPGGAE